MSLYKRGKIWWFKFMHKGRLIQESTRTRDRKTAEKIYHKVRYEIAECDRLPNEHVTLKELIERYEAEYTPKKKDQVRDRVIFKNLSKFFGECMLLKDIETKIGDYESYRISQGASPATIVKELGLLRRMFNVAIKKWRWVKENPVGLIEMPQVNNQRVRYLSAEEYERLFKSLVAENVPTWLKPIVVIALNTGLRQANLLDLRWSQINLRDRLICIEGHHMKNRESLGIPLTQETYEVLVELSKVRRIEHDLVFHEDGEPIYKMKLHRAFRKVCKAAQVSDFRFHDLRHTFASYLRQKGVDLHTISKLLSHKDTRMTQRYAHLSVDSLRQAVAVFGRGVGTVLATSTTQEDQVNITSA